MRVRSALLVGALALTVVVAGRALAQSCGTGDARVTFDPVQVLVTLPQGDPVQLAADKDGRLLITSPNAPLLAAVATPDVLRQRNATRVRFTFAKNTTTTIAVRTSAAIGGLEKFVALESAATRCGLIDSGISLVGRVDHDVSPDQAVFQVSIGEDPGIYEIGFRGRFTKDTVYELVLYSANDKGDKPPSTEWDLFVGAESAVVAADPELKLAPIGYVPATNCPGTDLSNLTEAISLELLVRQHVDNVEEAFNPSDLQNLNPPKKSDFRTVENLLNLSIEHLECAKEIVEARDDLPDRTKETAVGHIDDAIADDKRALARLTAPVKGIRSKEVRDLARLSGASTEIVTSVNSKIFAAQAIDPEFADQQLEPVYDSKAPLQDKIDKFDELEASLSGKVQEYSDTLARIQQRVQDEGQDGLAVVLASNEEFRCRRFLELQILGDLRKMIVAIQPAGVNLDDVKDRKRARKLVKLAEQSARNIERSFTKTEKLVTPSQAGRLRSARATARRTKTIVNFTKRKDLSIREKRKLIEAELRR